MVANIKQTLLLHLQAAVTNQAGDGLYHPDAVIQLVTKQLKAFQHFAAKQAGALMHLTLLALQNIFDNAVDKESRLC